MKKIALCIGINDYPGTGSDLAGCVNDAADWMRALGYRGFSVNGITDDAATKTTIVKEIKLLLREPAPATFAIQYSGHGSYVPDESGDEPDGVDECWCPHDFDRGVLTDDELQELFAERAPGTRLVLISDSCHSGTVSRFAPDRGPVRAATVRFLPPAAILGRVKLGRLRGLVRRVASRGPGRLAAEVLLAGCQDHEYSYDAWFSNRPNGAFTRAAIDALEEVRENASYSSWHKAILEQLPSRLYPQTPNLWGMKSAKRRRLLT